MKALLNSIRTKCPGQRECDDAIDTLNDAINQLDQTMLATMTGSLQPNASSSLQVHVHVLCMCICSVLLKCIGY